jgi:hypothetical protein
MTLYGIRHKKTLIPLGISIFSNEGGEFCNPAGARFEYSDFIETNIYCVSNEQIANKALLEDPGWYNASLDNPQWYLKFNPDDFEVFELINDD